MRRVLTPELMDDPGLDPAAHASALCGLARLNALARSDRILWPALRELARSTAGPLRVLDLATGSADVPIALARRAEREGVALDLSVCDISSVALEHAAARARRRGVSLHLWQHDAVTRPFERRFDAVTCSLFLHHLNTQQAGSFLKNAADATGRMLLVSDLRRDPAGLAVAWGASRVATRSRVVHVDAVKSVRAAYTLREVGELARSAGLSGARVSGRWPWRMLLRWSRD